MYDVAIIGGGPAGLSAAIYTGRRALKTIILTTDIGGQIGKSSEVENYPGIDSIKGIDLALKFKAQADKFGAEIKYEQVSKIAKEDGGFSIKTLSNKYKAKAIILAFGKKPMELGVPGEEKFIGKGVSYCATCDAPFFRGKKVAIAGGGNSAIDAAILAASYAETVYLIHRREELRADQAMIDKAKANAKIEFILGDEIAEILGEKKVEKLSLESGKELAVDGIIVEIGYVVKRELAENLVDMDEKNQIIINNRQETSMPGIFAAGDLTNTPFKQVVVSAGEGAKAALSAYDYIQKIEGKKSVLVDWH